MGQQKTKIIGMEEIGAVSAEQMKKVGRKRLKAEKAQNAEKAQAAQVAISTSGAIEQIEQVPTSRDDLAVVRPRVGRARQRSARYKQVLALVDRKKGYGLEDAIGLVKKSSYSKFDGTVELHVKTIAKKGQDPIRALVTLPAGMVKSPKVVVASEALVQEIEKGKLNFDIILSTPEMMPKLAKVAKILGPKGLMPNPKAGTVVGDPQKAIEEINKGRTEIRQDPLGNIHAAVGKVSWEIEKLKQNIAAVLRAVPTPRVDRITLTATMSPGVKVTKV